VRNLLDVNALLALGLSDHDLHERVVLWMKRGSRGAPFPVATCALTELAFVRILSQPVYGYTIAETKGLLEKMKGIPDLHFSFLADDQPVSRLPSWVNRSGEVTDGHLLQVAERHGARLATLDEKIPGAFLIPHHPVRRGE
jgi:predicted nucleic acid-binding protein